MSDAYNASDTKAIRRAQREARLAEDERRLVVLNLMSSPAGRNWIHAWLLRCHVFNSPFTAERNTTDFKCGEQNIGLQLLSEVVSATPDQYIAMMREAKDKEHGRRNTSDHSESRGRSQNGGRNDSGSAATVISEYNPGDAEGAGGEDGSDGAAEA